MIRISIISLLLGLFSVAHASPPDGFVLTQWGQWTQNEALRAVDQAKSVGARHISILVMLCQSTMKSSDIRWCETTSPYESVRTSYQGLRFLKLLPELKARGFTVSFIPFMAVDQSTKHRGWIWPKDQTQWFKNYGDKMVELAVFARDTGVSEFIVGSELTLLFEVESGWRDVIRRIRPVFQGHLTISPIAIQYQRISFWDALDSIGVSAYFPLTLFSGDATIDSLKNGWKIHRLHLENVAKLYGKPLTFVEVGYPNTEVASQKPWDYDWSSRTLNYELSRKCWEAFKQVWASSTVLRGFRIWGLTGQPTDPIMGFSPMGKPSEAAVRSLFSDSASR